MYIFSQIRMNSFVALSLLLPFFLSGSARAATAERQATAQPAESKFQYQVAQRSVDEQYSDWVRLHRALLLIHEQAYNVVAEENQLGSDFGRGIYAQTVSQLIQLALDEFDRDDVSSDQPDPQLKAVRDLLSDYRVQWDLWTHRWGWKNNPQLAGQRVTKGQADQQPSSQQALEDTLAIYEYAIARCDRRLSEDTGVDRMEVSETKQTFSLIRAWCSLVSIVDTGKRPQVAPADAWNKFSFFGIVAE